jgi:hypothetical protein
MSLQASGAQVAFSSDSISTSNDNMWSRVAVSSKTVKYASIATPTVLLTDPSGVGTAGTTLTLGAGTEFIRNVKL